MYPGYLFITILAATVSGAACKDAYLDVFLDNSGLLSLKTDSICRSAGFIPKLEAKSIELPTKDGSLNTAGLAAEPKMSTGNIILVALAVVAACLIAAFLGIFFYKKAKTQ